MVIVDWIRTGAVYIACVPNGITMEIVKNLVIPSVDELKQTKEVLFQNL